MNSFERGGTERQMVELACRLDRNRFHVHVICFRRDGPWFARVANCVEDLLEIPLRSFKSRSAVEQFLTLVRWLRARRITLLHACELYANIFALPAAAVAGVPVRIGSRRGIRSPADVRGLLALQRLGYMSAHRIVANSRAAAARVREEGVSQRKITVIPNGLNLDAFPRAPRRTKRRVVVTVANLRRGKGLETLLGAAALVLRHHADARFKLVGDGALRASLEAQAAALGISGSVDFLGSQDDIGRILQGCDLFACPSHMEAFPNVVMEAMAAGLPVVASDVGGIPELIADGRSGVLVPPGAVKPLADAIVRLMDDGDLATTLGAEAHRGVAANYSFDRMIAAMERLYLSELPRGAT
jgi:L-malate glycosyltransferase